MLLLPTGLNSEHTLDPLLRPRFVLIILAVAAISTRGELVNLPGGSQLPSRLLLWSFSLSPRWLVKVGREDEARYILGRLRGETGEDVGKAEAEFQDIRNIAELERKTAKSQSYISMLFGIGSGKLHTGRRVQLVIWLQIMQEWIGIAGVTIFAPTIFRTAGIPNDQVQWISGLNTITYMVSSPLLEHSILC